MRKKNEIEADIAVCERKLATAKKNSLPAMVELNEGKLVKLNKELDEYEASPPSPDPVKVEPKAKTAKVKAKKEPKAPKEKKARKASGWSEFSKANLKEYLAKYGKKDAMKKMGEDYQAQKGDVKEPAKSEEKATRKVGSYHELHDTGKNVWIMKNIKSDKAEFEIEKIEGKFKVTCIDKKQETFDTLDEAIAHIESTFKKGIIGDIMKEKKHNAQVAKAWKDKNPNGLTPAKAVHKTVEKVEKKLEEKKEDGKSTEADQEALVNQTLALIKLLDEKFVEKLILALIKLLDKKFVEKLMKAIK